MHTTRAPRIGRRGRTYVLYSRSVRSEYRLEPCRSALNAVRGMPFKWSLNPYMGCVHRCTFCYVRHFEQRADRPSDDRYGRSIRVKTNVAEVLREELARPGWKRETVSIGAATDPYQPAEARIDGSTVVVSSSSVPAPVLVRYAWADNPEADLYNSADLPASPFRSGE